MKNPTVQELRQQGFKVRVIHNRRNESIDYEGALFNNILEKGGYTRIDVTTPEGVNSSGESYCANIDNYNKKLGVTIALGRALKDLKERGVLV